MGILKKIGIAILVLILVFLVVAMILPGEYKVERSTVVNTEPEVVYSMVADLNMWLKWSPWVEMDPNTEYTFTGEAGKVNSTWSWKGEVVGEGSLTHVELVPHKSISSTLEFTAPQEMTSKEQWTFEKAGEGTKVTWVDEGELGYPVGRYFGLFLDGMLGADFEKGLAKLKTISEEKAAQMAKEANTAGEEEKKEEAPEAATE